MIHKFKLSTHEDFKKRLLDFISNQNVGGIHEGPDSITKSDNYVEDRPELKPYFDWIANEVVDHVCEYYCMSFIRVTHVWYQQYEKDDIHQWHVHPSSSASIVYFAELPGPEFSTEFFNPDTRELVKLDCEEGDVLVFPAHIPHRSPPLTSDQRKTIVGVNMVFERVDTTKFLS